MKCIALWGEPGAMIDGCIHLPLMTLHAIIITDKYNTSYVLSVYKQQCGYMNRSMVSYQYVMKAAISNKYMVVPVL